MAAQRIEQRHPLGARSSRPGARGCGAASAAAHPSGFTVLELLVSVSLIAVVMTIVLTTFDVNSALSRVQQDVAELQQSVRVAQREIGRNARMTGRGGLPRPLAIRVTQDVPPGISIGSDDDGRVLPGTDVLTLRGTFQSPIYKVEAGDEDTFTIDGNTATLFIDDVTRSGFEQSLDRLAELASGGGGGADPEPILLVSRQGDTIYAVVELANITIGTVQLPQGNTVNRATLTLNISPAEGMHTTEYLALSSGGAFPAALTSVLFASVLEEFRYYIREDHTIPGDDSSPLSPKLSRARIVPGTGVDPVTGAVVLGTETVHPEAGSIAVDIADGVFDLQLALGIDLDADGVVDERDDDGVPLAGEADEWLWNHADDDEGLGWDASTLRLVRLSFLGQAGRPDRQYIAPAIVTLENRDYSEPQVPTVAAEIAARRYRRRMLQSVIDLRNL